MPAVVSLTALASVVVTGEQFPDGIAAAGLAGCLDRCDTGDSFCGRTAILLTRSTPLPPVTADAIRTLGVPADLSDTVATQIDAALTDRPGACGDQRVGGTNAITPPTNTNAAVDVTIDWNVYGEPPPNDPSANCPIAV